MNKLTLLILLFAIAVTINSAAVYGQRRYKVYTRLFGRYDWYFHVLLLSAIWIGFLSAVILIQLPIYRLSRVLRPLGIISALIGAWLIIVSWSKLGTAGTCNGWYFGRGPKRQLEGGVFKLHNPMYSGFVWLFVSTALWSENASYLWLAGTSFILLNLIQARVEEPEDKKQ